MILFLTSLSSNTPQCDFTDYLSFQYQIDSD
ncbi:hypothetical protein DIKCMJMK_02690 [Shewanella oneidensis]|nr:hypothetical protein [Shewanella oneidensis]